MGCPLVCAEHLEVKFLLLVSTRVGADEMAIKQLPWFVPDFLNNQRAKGDPI